MSVTVEKIDIAVREAQRFIKRASSAKRRLKSDKYAEYGCKETGAVRRASMDLTRALVGIRATR